MTSPPAARIVEIAEAKVDPIGWLVEPSQYTVQEPDLLVWTNAIDRYFAPEACATVAGLSEE